LSRLASYPNPLLRGWRFAEGVPTANSLYRFLRALLRVGMCMLWKVRVFNRHYEPTSGSAVYICNHQSFLDPMLMSFALFRPMNYMARDTLFRLPLFKQLITSLNAFPVRRNTADTGALKEAMRRLKKGGQLVVFPEGTRTRDGQIGPFLPGVTLLCQKAADWTIPVLIDGAFEAWPRTQTLPSPGNIIVQYARPISREQVGRMSPKALTASVRDTLIGMQSEVRRRVGRPALEYR